MLKDFVFIQRKLFFLQVFFFTVLFFVFGYFVVNPRATLRWIPTKNETKVLSKIAATIHTQGDVRRKLVNDLLWLPVEDQMQLYYGDTIFSANNSAVEIIFSEKQSIKLKENSLVRIGLYQGKPLVELITGEFNVEVKEPEIIYVRQAKGINRQEAMDEVKSQTVSSRKTAEQTLAPMDSSGSDKSKAPEQAQEKTEPAPTTTTAIRPVVVKAVFKPFPAENTVFLHFGGGHIRVSSEAPCAHACELQISSKRLQLKKEFAAGEIPQLQVKVNAGLSDQVQWSLKDGGETFHSQFEIRPYNETFFKKAISDKKKIEVLGE
jgi:hypothetical protein